MRLTKNVSEYDDEEFDSLDESELIENLFESENKEFKMKNVNIDSITAQSMGISILTGEACALSMRLLCELTPVMMQTYLDYTGIKASILDVQKSTWNDRDSYAVFLTWEVIEDLIIMTLMQSYNSVVEVIPNDGECNACGVNGRKHLVCGMQDELKNHFADYTHLYSKNVWNESTGEYDKTQGLYDVGRTYHIYDTQPHTGFSNIHGFSGVAH
jgi:hypothetical protein